MNDISEEKQLNKLITVVTPTFNRSKNLPDCYHSLVNQTNQNFIWMIIDDGSTDNTEELVKKWISEEKLDIQYIKKKNGGKASAINLSLEKCTTELWMCLDSDDYLTKNCIELIVNNYDSIKESEKICGFLSLRVRENGKPINNQKRIPKEISQATLKYVRYELNIETEYVTVYKTRIIKKYPYPIIENEIFMPLSYVYDQIDLKYTYNILHEDMMIGEYTSDGMTRNKNAIIKKNPKGYHLFNKQRIELATSLKWKLKAVLLYGTGPFMDKDLNFFSCVKNSPTRVLTFLLFPLSWLVYLKKFK